MSKKIIGVTVGTPISPSKLQQKLNTVDKTYLISVFEELKTAIEESDLNAAVAILDRAILDLSKLA